MSDVIPDRWRPPQPGLTLTDGELAWWEEHAGEYHPEGSLRRLVEEVRRLRPPRAWTTEPPTVPGWYGWRLSDGSCQQIIEVGEIDGVLWYWMTGCEYEGQPANLNGEWCGPYTFPE